MSSLEPGSKLGPFEILAPLGSGGMGEVYRARDPRLSRDVAIKILHPTSTWDASRMRRFEQEARAAGSLNHPNLLSVFELGEHAGSPYIVFELLEGSTLRQRSGPAGMPPRKAIDYAIQIANGLAAAHEKGIVHRDLKPDNLFVTPEGRVKILDFGLAKLGADSDSGDPARSTQTGLTHPGTIVGTTSYMSPEQVRGQAVDARSDLFAFGSVLYEMLSGKQAFAEETAAETMSAILNKEPTEAAAASSWPALKSLLHRCLEKKPAERFQSARDLAFALEAISQSGPSGTLVPPARPPARPGPWLAVAALIAAAGLLALVAARLREPLAPTAAPVRFSIASPPKATYANGDESTFIALSPDGCCMAFCATEPGIGVRLWLRRLDKLDPVPLAGTEGADSPFWAPDSQTLGFSAVEEGKLKKVGTTGGQPVVVGDVPKVPLRATWARDGTILFTIMRGEGIYRVTPNRGVPEVVMRPDPTRDESRLLFPVFLPDGSHFLYIAEAKNQVRALRVGTLGLKDSQEVASPIFSHVRFASPDRLLYVNEGSLLSRHFNLQTLRPEGEPQVVVDRVSFSLSTGNAEFSASDTGVLAYFSSFWETRLAWFGRNGAEMEGVGIPGGYTDPRLSPDGTQVAVSFMDYRLGTYDIWTHDLARHGSNRVTFDPHSEYGAQWSPDSKQLLFAADWGGPPHLFRKSANGTGPEEELLPAGEPQFPRDWSRDGRFVAYTQVDPKTKDDIWILPLVGDRKPFSYGRTPLDEYDPQFSPDGKSLAFTSNQTGREEVFVGTFPESSERLQISSGGGHRPRWASDGRELYYLSGDSKLMTAHAHRAGSLQFDRGIPLFSPRDWLDFDVGPDGRFLVELGVSGPARPIQVVLNWTRSLGTP